MNFKKSWLLNFLLVLVSVVFSFFAIELALRIYKKNFSLENYLSKDLDLFHSAYPSVYDPELGWIPKPGTRGTQNVWGTQVTIGKEGIRLHPSHIHSESHLAETLLTVGDSYTFGDQVSDAESWPAHLEKKLNIKVMNGGVFGYGLDQSILRAIQLSKKINPDYLIVSFIAEDVERCELKLRTNVAKPYFVVRDGALELKNQPVPTSSKTLKLGFIRHLLGYSLAAHTLMMRVAPRYWLEGTDVFLKTESTQQKGFEIGCLLPKYLAGNIKIPKKNIIFLGQYMETLSSKEHEGVKKILDCARKEGFKTLDLFESLESVRKKNITEYKTLFIGHMSSKGNEKLAEEIAKFFKQEIKHARK